MKALIIILFLHLCSHVDAAGAGSSDEPHSCQLSDADLPLYEPGDHRSKFKPELYLNAFYRTPHEEGAMSMVLFFLPSMCYRMDKCDTMLGAQWHSISQH